jgi:hypothetical protein
LMRALPAARAWLIARSRESGGDQPISRRPVAFLRDQLNRLRAVDDLTERRVRCFPQGRIWGV